MADSLDSDGLYRSADGCGDIQCFVYVRSIKHPQESPICQLSCVTRSSIITSPKVIIYANTNLSWSLARCASFAQLTFNLCMAFLRGPSQRRRP